jgi:hypothetical protein
MEKRIVFDLDGKRVVEAMIECLSDARPDTDATPQSS